MSKTSGGLIFPINNNDDNYTDGTTFTGPLQLGGAPLAFTQPNGTKVECVPIPSAPMPV